MYFVKSDYTRYYSECSLIRKQKDMINHTATTHSSKALEIKVGILAAIKLSNMNLIHMRDRMESKGRLATTYPILQSEALSFFKGNLTRMLKQLFQREAINRIKSICTYIVKVHEDWGTIEDVSVRWDNDKDAHYLAEARGCITDGFGMVTTDDILQQAIEAMREVDSERKDTPILKAPTLSSINFDSITNIKFQVK